MPSFICDICGAKFEFKYEIIAHLQEHRSVKPKDLALRCNVCNKSFSRKETYLNHTLWHTGKSPHICTVCAKSFTTRANLLNHEKKHNAQSEASSSNAIKAMYKCNYCDKRFTRKEYLKAHIAIHTQESQHKCEHCSKIFTRKEYLANHIRIHTGETPFKCELCSKQFSSKKSLKSHSDAQCQANFVCPICSKSFTKKSSATNHINRAHCTDGKFECVECGKGFAVSQNLVLHMKSHAL